MAYIIKNKFPIDLEERKAVGFSLPLDGPAVFKPTYTTKEQLKSNLINYFLTNKGERYLNYHFGANLRDIVFEGIVEENLETFKMRIESDLKRYFPQVSIKELNVLGNEDQNLVKIEITYNVVNFGIEDTIDLIIQ